MAGMLRHAHRYPPRFRRGGRIAGAEEHLKDAVMVPSFAKAATLFLT
jgi:hypothetical protein